MKPIKLITIVGARPQFIKAFPISCEIENRDTINEIILHTGQHYESNMSGVFFAELSIPEPKYNLCIHGATHGAMTGRMIEKIEDVLRVEKPDAVLVYGDTNSTLAGAIASSKMFIPLIHIEAGMRARGVKKPEEINRILTDRVSTLLFCSTYQAVQNLKCEGIVDNVFHSGDVMYDASIRVLNMVDQEKILKKYKVMKGTYSFSTLHRAENTDNVENLKFFINYLSDQARSSKMIFAVHPRTQKAIEKYEIATDLITEIQPVGYCEAAVLIKNAHTVFTDSGGMQKEAYFHGTPCVTLRPYTEWGETINTGWNRLWDHEYRLPRQNISEYGDGQSAQFIVKKIEEYLL